MDLGERVGWFLRSAYSGARAKRIANQFGVSETTAKRWLSGVRPTLDHLESMARTWGWEFVRFVYEPVCGGRSYDEKLSADLAEMQARLARLEARDHASSTHSLGQIHDGVSPRPSPMVGADPVRQRQSTGERR